MGRKRSVSSTGWRRSTLAALLLGATLVATGAAPVAAVVAAPPNDNVASANVISDSLPGSDLGVNATAATIETGEPTPTCKLNDRTNTVWYKFVAPVTTTISASVTPTTLAGNHVDPIVALWQGTDFLSFVERGCARGSSWGYPAALLLSVVTGTTYYFQVGGTFGSGPVSAFDFTLVDTSAPTVTTPKTSLPSGVNLGTSGIPVTATWTGTGHPTAIASYNVELKTDGGAWVAQGTTLTAAKSFTLISGHAYQVRVQAVDAAARTSTWATSSLIQPVASQETSTKIVHKKTWTTRTSAAYYGGHAMSAKVAGAYASFTFTGRSVAWVSTRLPSAGSARVYVNGTLVTTINLNAATSTYRRVVWAKTWTTSATRVVKVVVRGTAGHPRVDVDAFLILR